MTDAVQIEEVRIEMTERGGRGRDGVSGDAVTVIHAPESTDNVWVLEPIRSGVAVDSLMTFTASVIQTTEAESFSVEVRGVNNPGDDRVVRYANADDPVDPRGFSPGDTMELRGKPVDPENPAEGMSHWELIGPVDGPALTADVLAGTGQKRVTPPGLHAWGEAARAQAGRIAFQGSRELVTASKPGRVEMVDPTRMLFTLRPTDDDYRDGYTRDYTDHVQWEWRNLRGLYHTLSADSWVLCSVASVFDGLWVEHANYSWDRMVGGTTNNGQIFSMFDAIQFGGRAGDGATTISALGGSGPGHANYDQTTSALLVTGGVKNGATISNGTDVQATLKPGEIINFSQFDIVGNRTLQGPGGFTFANVNLLRRLGGGSQLLMNDEVAFVDSEAVGLSAGTGFNCCFRKANQMQGRSGPDTVSAVATVGLRDNHVVTFPGAWRVTGWKDTSVGHCLEIEQPDTYRPFRRNGTQVTPTSANDPLMIDEAAGPKVRQYSYQGSTTFDAETGNTLSFLSYLKAVRANGA